MKSMLTILLAVAMPLAVSSQEKPKKKKDGNPPPTTTPIAEKKSLPKKVYRSWIQVNQNEENQSLSGKLLHTFAKVLKPATQKED